MTLTQEQIRRLHIEDGLISDAGEEGEADRAFRAQVRDALLAPNAPSLVGAVMSAVGGESLSIGEAIRDAAGPAPSLWPAVAEAAGIERSGLDDAIRDALIDAADAPSSQPTVKGRSSWRWLGYSGVAAAAAAALAFFALEGPERVVSPVADAFEPVVEPVVEVARAVTPAVPKDLELPGITIIESLESETASVLQVLQFDDEAPTIIFIEEENGE